MAEAEHLEVPRPAVNGGPTPLRGKPGEPGSAGAFHSFRKSEVKSISKETGASLMPGYRSRLSAAELDDLVAYLASLGGAP